MDTPLTWSEKNSRSTWSVGDVQFLALIAKEQKERADRLQQERDTLLAAAQGMIDYWLTGGAGAGDPDGPLPSKVEGRAIAALHAAITTATGEEK